VSFAIGVSTPVSMNWRKSTQKGKVPPGQRKVLQRHRQADLGRNCELPLSYQDGERRSTFSATGGEKEDKSNAKVNGPTKEQPGALQLFGEEDPEGSGLSQDRMLGHRARARISFIAGSGVYEKPLKQIIAERE
jgi:hypothetical protein